MIYILITISWTIATYEFLKLMEEARLEDEADVRDPYLLCPSCNHMLEAPLRDRP